MQTNFKHITRKFGNKIAARNEHQFIKQLENGKFGITATSRKRTFSESTSDEHENEISCYPQPLKKFLSKIDKQFHSDAILEYENKSKIYGNLTEQEQIDLAKKLERKFRMKTAIQQVKEHEKFEITPTESRNSDVYHAHSVSMFSRPPNHVILDSKGNVQILQSWIPFLQEKYQILPKQSRNLAITIPFEFTPKSELDLILNSERSRPKKVPIKRLTGNTTQQGAAFYHQRSLGEPRLALKKTDKKYAKHEIVTFKLRILKAMVLAMFPISFMM